MNDVITEVKTYNILPSYRVTVDKIQGLSEHVMDLQGSHTMHSLPAALLPSCPGQQERPRYRQHHHLPHFKVQNNNSICANYVIKLGPGRSCEVQVILLVERAEKPIFWKGFGSPYSPCATPALSTANMSLVSLWSRLCEKCL